MNYSLPGLYYYKPRRPQRKFNWIWVALALVMLLLLLRQARSEEINWDDLVSKIIILESNGNPNAISKDKKHFGLMQISEDVVAEYVEYLDKKKIKHPTIIRAWLYNPQFNVTVGTWYLSIRIPQMLKAYSIKPCAKDERFDLRCWKEIDLQIIAWNWGIGNLVKWYRNGARWNKLPKETQNYIKRYQKLERKK